MAENGLVGRDLDVVGIFMDGFKRDLDSRIESTFGPIAERVKLAVPMIKFRSFGQDMDVESQALWGYGYLTGPHLSSRKPKQYLAWGICYPEATSDWSKGLKSITGWPHAIVAIGYEVDGDYPAWTDQLRRALPQGWIAVDNPAYIHTFIAKPIVNFPRNPPELFQELGIWATDEVKKVEPFLRAMNTAYTQQSSS